jgi:hypothetical protein
VYVDNDPLVLVHARALLRNTTAEGVTGFIDYDFHNTQQLLQEAGNILNVTEPIAVMFMGSLGHVGDYHQMRFIVAGMMDAVPSGSYLVLWDSTNTTEGFNEAQQGYNDTGAVPYVLRTPDQLRGCFEGLELIEPGLVSISQWRPGPLAGDTILTVDGYGAVARKP